MKYNNGDLSFDLEKIKTFDAEITIAKAFDSNLDYQYAIDVEDTSYWYANEDERDADYQTLFNDLKGINFMFVHYNEM